ncbi:MAG TPA: DUF3300 domain-containing protein [Candidatus Sulfotelmatobacter sp.]|nr:DUF3300 domain-containing protein [Candidatus Sulfotelmatobacter sp.]
MKSHRTEKNGARAELVESKDLPESRHPRGSGRSAFLSTMAQILAVLLILGVTLAAQVAPADSEPGWSSDSGTYASGQLAPRQPLDAGQLEQLVAPIALYPDGLVAQILAASTYPPQVEEADRWRQAQGYANQEQLAEAADMQPWDPSVKALTAFPQVLSQMDRNLQWTSDLGNAYYNQPQDVMEAIQVMRRRAQAAGTLQSSPQEVVSYNQGVIELAPPSPQVVYVPAYNPWTVYGDPVTPYPGFSLLGAIGEFFSASPLHYGLGIAMAAFTHTPWGWLAWGLNWLTQAILFHSSDYYSHSASVRDWGFSHHGLHAYAGHGFARGGDFGRMRGGEGWRHEGWRGGGNNAGWHSFGRENGMHAQNWGDRSNRGFGGFESARGRNSFVGNSGFRSMNNARDTRAFRSDAYRGGSERSWPGYRAPAQNFQRGDFRNNRNSGNFGSHNFGNSYAKSQRSGGGHLFGASRSQKSFGGGHSGGMHFGGGHAPKSFGGGGRSFGGGHSHGGGHSSGHGGGGKHHR